MDRQDGNSEENSQVLTSVQTDTTGVVAEREPIDGKSAEKGEPAASPAAPPKVSRKVRRRARRTRPRSKTIAMKRLTREELRLGALLNPPVDIPAPRKSIRVCSGI